MHRKTPVPEVFFSKAPKFLRTPFFIEHLGWLLLKQVFFFCTKKLEFLNRSANERKNDLTSTKSKFQNKQQQQQQRK